MATTNAQYITDVVKYTNQERKKAGLPPLTVNSLLNKAAQTHSQNMALKDFYDHQGVDGKWPYERIEATGYKADSSQGYFILNKILRMLKQNPAFRCA